MKCRSSNYAVDVEKLVKIYGEVRALKGVSLRLGGERFSAF